MARSDLYVTPDKSELARLSRAAGSMARSMAESEEKDDQMNSRVYHLAATAWRLIHDGERDAAGAVAMIRAAGEVGDLDAGAAEGVIEQMENVLLRGYRDTLMAALVASPRRDPLDAPGPEPAKPMSMLYIYRIKRELGQPPPLEPTLDEADQERAAIEAAVAGQLARSQVGMPRRGFR
jgi:hypothetical protein